MVEIRYAVEGETDAVLAARLIEACGGRAVLGLIAKGKPKLDPKVGGILRASNRHQPWLVLRDLDNDAECAATLLARLAPIESEFSAVRVAVRQAESWLLADRDAFASAFAVPVSKVAAEPDACEDAKRALVDACQNSRRRQLRDDMVPRPGAGRKVGPGYEANLTDFIASTWDPWRASARSDSLRRALSRVTDLIERCQAPGIL